MDDGRQPLFRFVGETDYGILTVPIKRQVKVFAVPSVSAVCLTGREDLVN